MDMEKVVVPKVEELRSHKEVKALVQSEPMTAMSPGQTMTAATISYAAISATLTWAIEALGGANYLFGGLFIGIFVLGMGIGVIAEILDRHRTQQVYAYLNQHHWQLREGFPHPADRTDTHPRWELMRTAEGGKVVIDIRRWEYIDDTWTLAQQPLCQLLRRSFALEELEDADVYADGLIATAQHHLDKQEELAHQQLIATRERIAIVSDRQQLAKRWLQQRPASEIVEAQQLPPANNDHKLLS